MKQLRNDKLPNFLAYGQELDATILRLRHSTSLADEIRSSLAERAMDGHAYAELKQDISRKILRKHGIFFTGTKLSERLAKEVSNSLTKTSTVLDPACGSGDLLLAIYKAARDKKLLKSKDSRFSVIGLDKIDQFTTVATSRFNVFNAAERIVSRKSLFKFECGNALDYSSPQSISHVVMNPPFTMMKSPDAAIGAGLISTAAVFVYRYIKMLQAGGHLVAILPEALFSGTRYSAWRNYVLENCELIKTERLGQFADDVDVDTFLLVIKKKEHSPNESRKFKNIKFSKNIKRHKTVADYFDVHVGAVVPHRDKKLGTKRGYLTAHNTPLGGELSRRPETRRYKGPVSKPPFLILRRTSRPGQRTRLVTTLVTGNTLYAIENHLLVLSPHNGSIAACKRLAKALLQKKSIRWIDGRIRCRHLTVSALLSLPYKE